jgi:phospholipid-binding lipoprotein MlaA
VKSFEVVNSTSLSIGDYESLQQAAIDPYVAVRDAYIQYRFKKIKGKNQQPAAETNKENTKENSNDKK